MSKTYIPILEITLQKTHIWLNELTELMQWEDPQLSYSALRAVLHALRDRLPIEVAAKLGAQLPILIRGIFYEGWVPAHTPLKIHQLDEFLELVASYLGNDLLVPLSDLITRKVFKVMGSHISEGEIEHLKKVLPQPIVSLWNSQ
jgi:uncharacterized protein (DUF2267 family)